MGKRELVLIALFAIVGVVVYQLTAPPAPAGSQGFNIGRMIRVLPARRARESGLRARWNGPRTEAVDGGVQELRFVLPGTELTVTGEDRPDISRSSCTSTSNGFDDAEAHRLAEASALSVTRAGIDARLRHELSARRRARRAVLTLKVPKRLRMRLDPMGGGKLDVSNLAGLEVMGMARRHDGHEHRRTRRRQSTTRLGGDRRRDVAQADVARRREGCSTSRARSPSRRRAASSRSPTSWARPRSKRATPTCEWRTSSLLESAAPHRRHQRDA